MNATEYARKLAEAQSAGTKATKDELAGAYNEAFRGYIEASQLYLHLIRNSQDEANKTKLKEVASKLLARAEKVKAVKRDVVQRVARDRLSPAEQDRVLDRSCRVKGTVYPPWQHASPPAPAAAAQQPTLSPAQVSVSSRWQRILPPGLQVYDPAQPGSGRDIHQGNVADCSVVAALIVAMEHNRRFHSKLAIGNIFPQSADGCPQVSASGQYQVRAMVNGIFRCIDINDQLPVSEDSQLMCVSTRDGRQIWPALLEKAYMKVMGGYDFRGSDSSIDFHFLTGWYPQQIHLKSATFSSERTWNRLHKSYHDGTCVVTIGTGPLSDEALSSTGLIPSHNYAVVGMSEASGIRELEIVNPWAGPASSIEVLARGIAHLGVSGAETTQDKSIFVSWDVLVAHFDSLYVNWDPKRFEHQQTAHLCLKRPSGTPSDAAPEQSSLRLGFETTADADGETWLLLSRHLGAAAPVTDEFIGLDVDETWEEELGGAGGWASPLTNLVNSPHVLAKFMRDQASASYDIRLYWKGALDELSCSLTVLSHAPFKLSEGPAPLAHQAKTKGRWTDRTAGGNHAEPSFFTNPQYRLEITAPAKASSSVCSLMIACETKHDVPVNVKALRAKGSRVSSFEDRDILVGGSNYELGRSRCRGQNIQSGIYTLVVSTFKPATLADFAIMVDSTFPVKITPLPAEGAGMYVRTIKGSWGPGSNGGHHDLAANPHVSFVVSQATTLLVRLQTTSLASPLPSIAVAIFDHRPSRLHNALATSGPFTDGVTGAITETVSLKPREEPYHIVPVAYLPGHAASYQLLVYSDKPVALNS